MDGMKGYSVFLSDGQQHHVDAVTRLLEDAGCTSIHSPFPGTIHYRTSRAGNELLQLEKALSDRPYVERFGKR